MFDLESIVYILLSIIFILLIGAMVGVIVYLWIIAVPLLAKIFWTIIFASMMLVFIAITLVVIEC